MHPIIRSRPFRAHLLVAGAAVVGGCEAATDPAPTVTVRDSAGIEIVESPAPLLGPDAWIVGPEASLEIGVVEGDQPYVFTRVWDATRLPGGRLAVVDEMTMEIRLFDPDGTHVRTFGGGGSGPAEFGGPAFVEAVDDSTIVAWDGGNQRMSWFRVDGALIDQVALGPTLSELGVFPFRNGLVWEIDAGGSLLSTGPARPERAEGLRDSFRRVVLVADRGDLVHDFGRVPSGQSFVVRTERASIGVGNPFAPSTRAALAPDGRVAIGDDEGWEIRLHEPTGPTARIIRPVVPRLPVTPELEQAGRDRAADMAERSPLTLRQAEEAYAAIPLPDSIPAIASIMTVGEELWVGRRVGRWFEVGDHHVFDPDGRWITTVTIPAEIERILELGEDYLLAHVRDELEVSYLRMYGIER